MSDIDNYYDKLSYYYKLKKKYLDKKNKILSQKIDIDEKKQKIKNIKCVHCNNFGGTIFSSFNDNSKNNILIAKCGNIDNPCKLNIQIIKRKSIQLNIILDDILNKIKELKTNIIKIKLNFIFNFDSQENSLDLFNKYREQLQKFNNDYNDLYQNYIDITDNYDNNIEIKKYFLLQNQKINELNEIYLLTKKDLISNYDKKIYMKEIAEIYINELININNNLLNLKYKINNVNINKEEQFLIQKKYNPLNLEVITEKEKIISYIK